MEKLSDEERRERRREYNREYYHKNKERLDAKHRQYYQDHKEEMQEYNRIHNREYRKTHAEQIKEWKKRYKEKRRWGYTGKGWIDEGKIMALYRAGWTVASIAFEVEASEDAVNRVIGGV